MIGALPILNITPAGYLFFLVIIISYVMAYLWLSKKNKASVLYVGLSGTAICFALLIPVMISFQFIEEGTTPVRIAVIAFWLLIGIIAIAIKRSKKINLGWSLLLYFFFGVCGLLLIVMIAGMGYFLYQRMFTHERDDAPIWAVFLCIFFLAVLIFVIVGQLFSVKKGKDGKTEFDNMQEALLVPEAVFTLDLSGQGLTMLPHDVLKFVNLSSLDLSNNQINQLPRDLLRLNHLAMLKLSNNPISDTERAQIRSMFPPETELIFRN